MNNDALNDEGRDLWNNKAAFWDNLHGDEGNTFHRTLVSPAVEKLLNLRAGERVLDIGCGNGALARRLAALGGQVTAVDFSAALIDLARQRQHDGAPIDYRVVDATDESALRAFGEGDYSAITCTMALMDMPVITPLYRAVRALLAENGRFVFAQSHPAFNSNNPVFITERGDREGNLYTDVGIKLFAYLDVPPVKGAGAAGEPNPHYYYHRPLHTLLGEAFAAGLVLDGLEEPAFPPPAPGQSASHWDAVWQFPPIIAGRFRLGV